MEEEEAAERRRAPASRRRRKRVAAAVEPPRAARVRAEQMRRVRFVVSEEEEEEGEEEEDEGDEEGDDTERDDSSVKTLRRSKRLRRPPPVASTASLTSSPERRAARPRRRYSSSKRAKLLQHSAAADAALGPPVSAAILRSERAARRGRRVEVMPTPVPPPPQQQQQQPSTPRTPVEPNLDAFREHSAFRRKPHPFSPAAADDCGASLMSAGNSSMIAPSSPDNFQYLGAPASPLRRHVAPPPPPRHAPPGAPSLRSTRTLFYDYGEGAGYFLAGAAEGDGHEAAAAADEGAAGERRHRVATVLRRQDSLRPTRGESAVRMASAAAPRSSSPSRPPRPARPPSLSCAAFSFEEVVGSGSFGEVWRAVSRVDGGEYAVKKSLRPFLRRRDRDSVVDEARRVLAVGRHRHVVGYHAAWQEGGHFYVQMEYCPRGTLTRHAAELSAAARPELAPALPEAAAWAVLAQLSQALAAVHRAGLVHMDVKPDNVYVAADSSLRLGDFGLAVAPDEYDGVEGDSKYLAPELLRQHARPSPAADVYSLGLAVYELVTGEDLPSQGPRWHQLRGGLEEHLFPSEGGGRVPRLVRCLSDSTTLRVVSGALSAGIKRVLLAMLSPDPAARPSAEQVAAMRPARAAAAAAGVGASPEAEEALSMLEPPSPPAVPAASASAAAAAAAVPPRRSARRLAFEPAGGGAADARSVAEATARALRAAGGRAPGPGM